MSQQVQSDDLLQRYLLGLAKEEECETVEQSYMSDTAECERLEALEDDVIEDYLDGRLTSAEKHGFENHFLNGPGRREKLAFARSLRAQLLNPAHARQAEAAPSPAGVWSLPKARFQWMRWATAASLALALISMGLLWIQSRNLSPAPPIPPEKQADIKSEPALPQKQPQSTGYHAPLIPSVIHVSLSPGLTRSSGSFQRVPVHRGAEAVKFNLELFSRDAKSLRAVLRLAEGKVLLSQEHLTPTARGQVIFLVPAELLHGGDYQISLSTRVPDGTYESAGTYNFRVVR